MESSSRVLRMDSCLPWTRRVVRSAGGSSSAPAPSLTSPLPAVADGVVYAGGGEGILLAVDAASGQERWRLAVGGEAIGAPAVAGGLVFVTAAATIGGGSAELVAVDAGD